MNNSFKAFREGLRKIIRSKPKKEESDVFRLYERENFVKIVPKFQIRLLVQYQKFWKCFNKFSEQIFYLFNTSLFTEVFKLFIERGEAKIPEIFVKIK